MTARLCSDKLPAQAILAKQPGVGATVATSRQTARLVAEWIAVAVVTLSLISACLSVPRVIEAGEVPTSLVEVEPGESLWRLAVDNPVPGLSVAETIHLIRRINGMETSLLHAGEIVEVPAQDHDERVVVSR